MFVIRIRGINDVAPKTKKILQLLRLLRINSGVFLKVGAWAALMGAGLGWWGIQLSWATAPTPPAG